jgi:excisionase family DNA binding protein
MSTTSLTALLTSTEAAKLLGIDEKTLQLWRYQRKIPYCRLGYRTVKFRVSDLESFIRKSRIPAKKEFQDA